jgi:hypothetical protein
MAGVFFCYRLVACAGIRIHPGRIDLRDHEQQPARQGIAGQPVTLERYLRHRRSWEIALWALFFLVQWVGNVLVIWLEFGRVDNGLPLWKPVVWEGSSLLVLAAMIPLLLAFDRRFPLRYESLGRGLLAHVLFTIPFSLIHVAGMVMIRKLAYAAAGMSYDFGDLYRELPYEYLKDFRTYAGFLAIIYLYRFVLLRAQGEARLLDPPQDPSVEPRTEYTERFLVKMLGKEFLVHVNDLDWLEASGNYVNLHVGQRCYPLRGTMAGMEKQLDPARFSRVHRSCIVNLDRISEIEPLDTGDARIRLKSGAVLPCSRRYRTALREQLEQ